MNKQELLEYLKAVCKAEEAKYACEEAIRTLKGQISQNYLNIAPPEKPVRVKIKPSEASKEKGGALGCLSDFGEFILIIVLCLAVFLLVMFLFDKHPELGLIVGALAAFGTFKGLQWLSEERIIKKSIAMEDSMYQRDLEKYNQEMKLYRDQMALNEKKNQVIQRAIAENEAELKKIKFILDRLYSKGVLYQSFQDSVAVHQILQYLEMGLCETLEGSTGAYAEYMKDVRSERICSSISDLKRAMVQMTSMIMKNQYILCQEMKEVNKNVEFLQNTVQNGMDGVNNVLSSIRSDTSSAANSLVEANQKLESMQRTLVAAAHNEYIDLHKRNAYDYCVRTRLINPGLI